MLGILLPILCTVLLGYLIFILVRAYRPAWFRDKATIVSTASPGSVFAHGSVPASGSAHGSVPGRGSGSASIEPFVQNAMGPPSSSRLNMPSQPTPSVAPPGRSYEVVEGPRTVSPGGPGAPNAQEENRAATISPDFMPIDPFQDSNMEAPIKDSMRHPELSFGPGMANSGAKAVASGVMNKGALSSETPFSPEFAQNGAQFMGSVTANDLSHQDTYATA